MARAVARAPQPALSAAVDSGVLRQIATVALDRRCAGFDPEQHAALAIVAAIDWRARGRFGRLAGMSAAVQPSRRAAARCRKVVEAPDSSRERRRRCVAVVGQRRQRLARQRQGVADPGEMRACDRRIAAPRRSRLRERDQMAGEVAAVDRRDVAADRAAEDRVSYQLKKCPLWRLSRFQGRSVASSRSTARACRASQSRAPRSSRAGRARCWSATSGARRRARDPPGSCPAAECCPSVTNVSKKRQVRRAISRSAVASASDSVRLPASTGATLTQRANAGAPSQATAKGAATGRAAPAADQTNGRPATRYQAPSHLESRSSSNRYEVRGLSRRRPVQEMAMTEEKAEERTQDRIHHQPRLVAEKGHEQGGLRKRIEDIRCRARAK